MSIDKSLRRKNSLQRARNVYTRGERILKLLDEERFQEGKDSPFGLPKVKVVKVAAKKKVKKEKAEEGAEAAPGAAPAAGAPAAAAKPAGKPGDKKK
ncbi:MAG: small basic protein [Gemmataceae bacterium]